MIGNKKQREVSSMGRMVVALLVLATMLTWTNAGQVQAAGAFALEIDSGLETAIREVTSLDRSIPITEDELAILVTLAISEDHRIESLQALRYALFLEVLMIEGNIDLDLSILTQLPRLQTIIADHTLNDASKAVLSKLEARGVDVTYLPAEPAKDAPIRVIIDGVPIKFTVDPVLVNGTTMVQFRPLFERFGLTVGWDQVLKTVTGTKERMKIELIIGDKTAKVSGQEVPLLQAPNLFNDNTLVPLRFIGETTGRRVIWNGDTREIFIDSTVASYFIEALYSNDTVYEGEQVDGLPNGQGTYTYKGNVLYEGQVVNGILEGEGKMIDYEDTNFYYEGSFHNNRFEGVGKTTYSDGSYHFGDYLNGMRDGVGKHYNPDGTLIYSGMYKNEAQHGHGTFIYDSFKYVGNYEFGVESGKGKSYYDNKLLFDGEWYLGSMLKGKYYENGKLAYYGDFVNNLSAGYGTYFDELGNIFVRGHFNTVAFTGVGIMDFEDGTRYVGEFYDGLADGEGVLKDANGLPILRGYFKNDEFDFERSTTITTAEWKLKELTRRSYYFSLDGINYPSSEITAQQAHMYIFLDSEEHLRMFQSLSQADQAVFINDYVQARWGDVLGVDECFTYVMFENKYYASATLSYELPNEQVEVSLYPNGKQLSE